MSMLDIESILSDASHFEIGSDRQRQLIDKCLETACKYAESSDIDFGQCLAAAFDLIVSVCYYNLVAHKGWLYSPDDRETLFLYPYTNTCPRNALQNKFIYHPCHKPRSGAIGFVTFQCLGYCLTWYSQTVLSGRLEVLKAREPIDIAILDRTENICLLGEVKASPLVTFPLAVRGDIQLEEVDGETQKIMDCREWPLANLYDAEINLMLFNDRWEPVLLPLGRKKNAKDTAWAFEGTIGLLENDTFFDRYFWCWLDILERYSGQKPKECSYWLANACGAPSPRPDTWPKRGDATGYKTISDSKTSVGMDRTDDLKKATYQVLKIGAETKFNNASSWNVKTGIVSNLPAIRHYQEYLQPIRDVIWTIDTQNCGGQAGDLDPDTPLYNLYDGLISFIECNSRDRWVSQFLNFSKKKL